MGRWLGKTSIVAPYTAPSIRQMLIPSAEAAAKSCSGGTDGVTCGEKWYVNGYDGSYGIGQQLSALEVIQALLVTTAPNVRNDGSVPIEQAPATTLNTDPTSSTSSSAAGSTSTGDSSRAAGTSEAFRVADMNLHGLKAISAALVGVVTAFL